MKLKLLSTLLIFTLFATAVSAAPVTPEKYEENEYMNNYNLDSQNNSYELACEIGQYVSETYGWNCDIRQLNFTNHTPVYINVFYPAADNKKGYDAYYAWFGPQKKEVTCFWGKDQRMYYRDWYEPGRECYIFGVESYGIVKSYYGNVTEENPTDSVENVTENENIQPVAVIVPENGSHDDENIIMINSDNSTVKNNEVENNTIENNVENSTNVVSNQGFIGTVEQWWFDFKNANLSNVSFNFFGSN